MSVKFQFLTLLSGILSRLVRKSKLYERAKQTTIMPFNCIQEKTHRSPLHHICVSSLQCAQKIITVDSKLSLYDAFKKLIDHSILSAPVYSESKSISVKEEETTERKYIGVLDIQQLVKVAVFQYDMQGRNELQNQVIGCVHCLKDLRMRLFFYPTFE